jgi:hypothetical protein
MGWTPWRWACCAWLTRESYLSGFVETSWACCARRTCEQISSARALKGEAPLGATPCHSLAALATAPPAPYLPISLTLAAPPRPLTTLSNTLDPCRPFSAAQPIPAAPPSSHAPQRGRHHSPLGHMATYTLAQHCPHRRPLWRDSSCPVPRNCAAPAPTSPHSPAAELTLTVGLAPSAMLAFRAVLAPKAARLALTLPQVPLWRLARHGEHGAGGAHPAGLPQL